MVFGMLWSAGLVLRTCAYKWINAMTRSMPGSGSKDCCKNRVRYEKQLLYKCNSMKNNCYINVKMLFENVRVRVCVQPYPPFPTTRHYSSTLRGGGIGKSFGWENVLSPSNRVTVIVSTTNKHAHISH